MSSYKNGELAMGMERPKNGVVICKFEIAGYISGKDRQTSDRQRESVAASIRRHLLARNRPDGVEPSSGSTTIRRVEKLPFIHSDADDTRENAERYTAEIGRLVEFVQFIERQMSDWRLR